VWEVKSISTEKRTLNFESSGQGVHVGTSIYANNELLFNQAESIQDHGDGEHVFQSIICDHCGFSHCESGNWIALRRIGDVHLILPVFDWIIEEEDSLKNEYFPPKYISSQGAGIIDSSTFDKLKELITPFKEIHEVKELTGKELATLYKYETPTRLFGDLPKIGQIKKDQIIGCSEGEVSLYLKLIDEKIHQIEKCSTVQLVKMDDNYRFVSFFLDDLGSTEWKAATIDSEGNIELLIDNWRVISN